MNFNQIKLEVNDSYREDEEKITSFGSSNDEDVLNKAYVDEKLLKREGSLIIIRKRLKRI